MKDLRITYAGHSAVFIELAGLHIAVDPWLKGNPLCPHTLQDPPKLDLIALTHGHSDHAGDAVRVQKLTGAPIAATYELAMIMIDEGVPADKVIPMNRGVSLKLIRRQKRNGVRRRGVRRATLIRGTVRIPRRRYIAL